MGKCEFTNPRIAYKSVRFFHFVLRGDGDAPVIIRKDEILKRLFAELRIISFDDELICTQMRDLRLTNPQSAYKAVRYFHFTLCGDGDTPVIIRKSEILMNPFAGLRINL